MAKTTAKSRKHNKIDLESLSQRDRDILSMDTKDAMKRYKMEKQGVYDRRFALNKKIREAGLSLEQLLAGDAPSSDSAAEETPKPGPKKTKASSKAGKAKVGEAADDHVQEPRELMVVPGKNVPVIMKPIEINFENFSIKLNGVPKKIAVNPDTNAIEIDL